MKKLKKIFIRHGITILTILFVLIAIYLSVKYAQKYSVSAKNTNDIRSIWQLAITAIAASVGIGTIINSTRSASTATESMRVTKEKELREQSSHPIILSLIDAFPYKAPLYNIDVLYDFPSPLREEYTKQEFQNLEKFILEQENRNRQQYINKIKSQHFKKEKSNYHLEVINTGKGSCVNLEYEFEFSNMKELSGHSVNYPDMQISRHKTIPSYSLSVNEYKRTYEISMIDNHIFEFIDSIDMKEGFKRMALEGSLKFGKENTFKNYSLLESGQKLPLPLPNEFIVLSKHYAIVEILKKKVENNEIYSSLMPSIEPLIISKPIKPVGTITLTFYDESLIRSGTYSADKKTKITYSVSIKDSAISMNDDKFDMYLEANLVKPEIQSKINKKRAYI